MEECEGERGTKKNRKVHVVVVVVELMSCQSVCVWWRVREGGE